MFITKQINENKDFNWEEYFDSEQSQVQASELNSPQILEELRSFLVENPLKMTLELTKLLPKLLEDLDFDGNLNVLELGAATGVLSRWLLNQYGGAATLVDNSNNSYKAFQDIVKGYGDELEIQYKQADIFDLERSEEFDIVCSFGLVEHFEDKKAVIEAHATHLKRDGIMLLALPMDSLLSRIYWTVHPELNLGYRELLTKSEFENQLDSIGVKDIKIISSQAYVYDFMVAACRV